MGGTPILWILVANFSKLRLYWAGGKRPARGSVIAMTFSCSCGEALHAPETAGREVLCTKCGKSVPVPVEHLPPPKDESGESVLEAGSAVGRSGETPPHCELVRDPDGKEHWKLTCYCGKRVRSPASIDQPYGRCPKCGRRMKLPGYLLSKKAFLISSHPGQGPVSAPSKPPSAPPPEDRPAREGPIRISELFENREREDELVTPLAPIRASAVRSEVENRTAAGRYDDTIPILPSDDGDSFRAHAAGNRVGYAAATIAADRLRPQHAGSGAGRISAWPLAGKFSRALAAFIDLTLTTAIVGILVILASQEVLPPFFLKPEVVVALLLAAGCVNDGLVHLVWGGSLGKKLVVIVTRTTHGRDLGAVHILVRAALKWMLFPGWIIGAIDPNERTLHDLLCGTLVLKGRAKHR